MNEADKILAHSCMRYALENGADGVRVSLGSCVQNSISILDGKLDKISFNFDRDIYLSIFTDSRYGAFSTNRLDEAHLKDFASRAVELTRLVGKDSCNVLPERSAKAVGCTDPDFLGLCDHSYLDFSQNDRIEAALRAAGFQENEFMDGAPRGWRTASSECEWSDSLDENYVIDSDGFEGLHRETSFGLCADVTIEADDGRRYSANEWDSAPFLKDFIGPKDSIGSRDSIGQKDSKPASGLILERAVRKAVSHIGPVEFSGGVTDVVVGRDCASRLLAPILGALDSQSIDQKNSFLEGCLGKEIFSPGLTVMDLAVEKGRPGSRLFDTEGLRCSNRAIIEKGVVKMNFTTAYMAAKLGCRPTVDCPSRPTIMPLGNCPGSGDIVKACGRGVYIYDFNGGNCNSATGNFSFGAEGFLIEDGMLSRPVRGIVMTGNIVELFRHLELAGADCRRAARWQLPTLLFRGVRLDG